MKGVLLALGAMLTAGAVQADTQATAYVNRLRADKDVPRLSYAQKLEAVAERHAEDMARKGYFAHEGSDGSQVAERVSAAGYEWCFVAENIAKGQKDMAAVLKAWEGSKGHYRNMVASQAREMGVARAAGDVWVMVLAAPCSR